MSESSKNGPSEAQLRAAVVRQGKARYFAIGIFVILGVVSFISVLFLLTDPAMFRNRYFLVTQLNDAGGVRSGDPVQMRGVNIGRINGFEMTMDGRVNIRMELKHPWEVPEGSFVQLAEAGVFGGRTVEIVPSDANTYMQPWDTIPGADSGGGLLESAGNLAEQAGDVMDRMNALLDTETIGAVQGSAREFERMASELRAVVAAQRDELTRLTTSLASTAEGLEGITEAGPNVVSASARADSLLAELQGTTTRLDAVLTSLDTVIGRMARGEGTLGRLSQDATLYDNLTRAMANLDSLLVDVKANPGRYVKIEIF